MRINRYNLIGLVFLCTTVVFGQKQSKKISESFQVNKDVLVEIDTRHSDVTVETWNKNMVDIHGVWEINGMTKDEASEYFKGWDFEALGNKKKVIVTSRSSNNYYYHNDVLDDFDFDFDFDSISHVGVMLNGDYFSELPPLPEMTPLPPMAPLPPVPVPFIGHLQQIEFDYDEYQKDKEGYMKKFEKSQQEWEKEFDEKFEPQMEAYEEQIAAWQKKMEPQMKAYEKKMEKWEKEVAPQMEEYEKKMEKKLKKMEKDMEVKYAQKIKEKEAKMSKYKIKKILVIKVPTSATLKIDARYGKISLPDNIKTID